MLSSPGAVPVGHLALIAKFGLKVPPPVVTSLVGPGARRTIVEDGRTAERYPAPYMPDDDLVGHLKFAMKYEPTDIGVLTHVFAACDPKEIEAWVKKEPNGAYARRIWFLYEWLTGKILDVPDAGAVTYVDALDERRHIVARGIQSKRHKVINNLLGSPGFCLMVRRTPQLEAFMKEGIDEEARQMIAGCDPAVLTRAINYLYTKETKSSFEIERETAKGQRAARFVAALRAARKFDPTDKESLVHLQNAIVEPRYAAKDFRDFQNFVGETIGGYREIVHFISPRPDAVASLMHDWGEMTKRLKGAAHPVVAAALISFGFVFIHPFDDGNGRIHRYLIHQTLSTEGFSPPNVLFPVSAAILRDRKGYDAALESVSEAIQPYIDWEWTPRKAIQVNNDATLLYRHFDATQLVEFLYAKVIETVRKDLKEELEFLSTYDAAREAVLEIIDMPDDRVSYFVNSIMQNGGTLSKNRRRKFTELSDEEIAELQTAVQEALSDRHEANDDDEDDEVPWRP